MNRVKFRYFLEDNLYNLQYEIDHGLYKPAPQYNKVIIYPKRRIAQVPAIRDKIVQHAMCDNGLTEMLSKPIIDGVSACIKNRGDSYASQWLKNNLRRYYLKHGKEFYALKCDIHSYFASIPHERLYKLIDGYVTNEDYKYLMSLFIEQMQVGVALGLPQSQLLANLYLSELDHKCKEDLKVRYYGRHMDDFYIISNDITYLKHCLKEITQYINSIGLEMNPKTCIMKNKLDFLGFTYHMTDTGKIIMRLLRSKRNAKRRELKKKIGELQAGIITADEFASSYAGWRVHALSGNCYSLVSNWDKWLTEKLDTLGYELIIHQRSVRINVKDN